MCLCLPRSLGGTKWRDDRVVQPVRTIDLDTLVWRKKLIEMPTNLAGMRYASALVGGRYVFMVSGQVGGRTGLFCWWLRTPGAAAIPDCACMALQQDRAGRHVQLCSPVQLQLASLAPFSPGCCCRRTLPAHPKLLPPTVWTCIQWSCGRCPACRSPGGCGQGWVISPLPSSQPPTGAAVQPASLPQRPTTRPYTQTCAGRVHAGRRPPARVWRPAARPKYPCTRPLEPSDQPRCVHTPVRRRARLPACLRRLSCVLPALPTLCVA